MYIRRIILCFWKNWSHMALVLLPWSLFTSTQNSPHMTLSWNMFWHALPLIHSHGRATPLPTLIPPTSHFVLCVCACVCLDPLSMPSASCMRKGVENFTGAWTSYHDHGRGWFFLTQQPLVANSSLGRSRAPELLSHTQGNFIAPLLDRLYSSNNVLLNKCYW